MSNYVLRFLDKNEIENFIDEPANQVISYLLKKLLFSQPELIKNQEFSNIQVTKEFLEQWLVQALSVSPVGAGNYPIDAVSVTLKLGFDIKFVSAKVDSKGNFLNRISNETSLGQKFTEHGDNLDQLFRDKNFDKILKFWKILINKKFKKAITEQKISKIYYFIFIRGGESINLAVAEVNPKLINALKVDRKTGLSVFVEGFCDPRYGQVKIYKSKKRMELRTRPYNLDGDSKLFTWDFSNIYTQKKVNLRNIISNKKKFKKYLNKEFDDLFSVIGHAED